ncbi:MAG: MBL fold metallo-hydrolase [Chloroflexi bacterium]|nr:MBL fold metallo-hydrolase [Chloroflexota bacterium]
MMLRTLTVGRLGTNCYVVACERTRQAMVVDPGDDAQDIQRALDELEAQARLIVLTHFHFDHMLAADPLRRETGATLAIHEADAAHLTRPPALFRFFSPNVPEGLVADQLLHDGDALAVGDIRVEVLHTPGHSPGGISLWLPEEQVVFSGDALFRQGIGRTDFPGCSSDLLLRSIREKLFALPDETVVYPGHGPATTIGYEKQHNPWVADGR